MARGNQAIDGMVWMPVMRDPKATRSTLMRATRLPSDHADDQGQGEALDSPRPG